MAPPISCKGLIQPDEQGACGSTNWDGSAPCVCGVG